MPSCSPGKPQTRDAAVRRQFARYAVTGGVAIGFLLGVLCSGPYLREWPLRTIAFVTLGFAAGGLLLGYLAEVIAKATMAEGATGGFGGDGHARGWNDHGTSDDRGDDGGCSDAGGGDCGGGGSVS